MVVHITREFPVDYMTEEEQKSVILSKVNCNLSSLSPEDISFQRQQNRNVNDPMKRFLYSFTELYTPNIYLQNHSRKEFRKIWPPTWSSQ